MTKLFYLLYYYVSPPPLTEERKEKLLVTVNLYEKDEERSVVDTMLSQHGDEYNSIALQTGSRLNFGPHYNLFHH